MFKVGDKVKCIDDSNPANYLTLGKLYEVVDLWAMGVRVVADDAQQHGVLSDRLELVKPEPQAAAIAGGLQEHSVGEYYPLAAVLYEHGDKSIITIENLQTGEVHAGANTPCNWGSFERAYRGIEDFANGQPWSKTKGRVSYTTGGWVVAEPANPVRVTRLRNMLHRG